MNLDQKLLLQALKGAQELMARLKARKLLKTKEINLIVRAYMEARTHQSIN